MSSPAAFEREDYRLKPIIVSAKEAHAEGYVLYNPDGSIQFRHPSLEHYTGSTEETIPLRRRALRAQMATFRDLNKAISGAANSPLLEGNVTLRERYVEARETLYEEVRQAKSAGRNAPDRGTYVFDHVAWKLHFIAEREWHKLALTINNSNLLRDAGNTAWYQLTQQLQSPVVAMLGVSVGGNVMENYLRTIRPDVIKLVDPDPRVELPNFNRLVRASLNTYVGTDNMLRDINDPFEIPDLTKLEVYAYGNAMVDPYLKQILYPEGATPQNIRQILLGNPKTGEPRTDLGGEEADDLGAKDKFRKEARIAGIPVVSAGDFGLQSQVRSQDFKHNPDQTIGFNKSDRQMRRLYSRAINGGWGEFWDCVRGLHGEDFASDELAQFINHEGEEPTSSIPQLGLVAGLSGVLGAWEMISYFLGYPMSERLTYDLKRRMSWTDVARVYGSH